MMAAVLTPSVLLLFLLHSITAGQHIEGPGPADSGGPGRTLGDQGDTTNKPRVETPSSNDQNIDPEAPDDEENRKAGETCELPTKEDNPFTAYPDKPWYARGEEVQVICLGGYLPPNSTPVCGRTQGSESGWDPEITCIKMCELPTKEDNPFTAYPDKQWYARGEEVQVTCPGGYLPPKSTPVCGRTQSSESGWDPEITCIKQCKKPRSRSTVLTLTPHKEWYNPGESVGVTCPTGYQPSDSTMLCRQLDPSTGSAWDETPYCIQRCRNPTPQWPPFTLSPYKPWYDRGDKVQVRCSEEKQPSPSEIQCRKKQRNDDSEWNATPTCIQKCGKSKVANIIITGSRQEYYGAGEWMRVSCTEGYEVIHPRRYTYVNVQCVRQDSANVWQPAVPCIEKCKPPSVENLLVPNNRLYYGSTEWTRVSCAAGYQPSHPVIHCIRQGSQNVWSEDVRCLEIKEEKLTVSARRITLTLTCSNSNCEKIWEISATARPDDSGGCSQGEQSTRCVVSYNKGTVSDCTALQPSSQYTLTVRGRYRHFSHEVLLYSARVRTNETVPDKPEMETNEVKINNKTIKWKKLSDCKGVIQGYQLNITSWRDYNTTFQEREHVTVNSAITEYTVRRPGTNYTITIQGFTSAGPGKPLTYSFTTVISEPVIPSFIILKEYNISATEKMVVLPLHPVPDIHGPISEYQIIVSRKRSMSEDICQREDLAPFNSSLDQDVYITAALPGHNLTSPEEFVLGDGTYQHGYYNAPLRTGHNYTAFLRVISIWDQDRTYSCALYGASPDAVQMKEGSSFTVFNGIQVAQIVIMLLGVMVVSLLFKSGTSQSSTLDSDEHGHSSVFS